MDLIKIDNLVLNLDQIKKFNLKPDGEIVIVFSRDHAYRITGPRADKLRAWLARNSEEI